MRSPGISCFHRCTAEVAMLVLLTVRPAVAQPLSSDPEGESPSAVAVPSETGPMLDGMVLADPAWAATVRHTINTSYRELGRLDEAETELTEAPRIRRGLFGDRYAEVADSPHGLRLLAWINDDHARPSDACRWRSPFDAICSETDTRQWQRA